MHLVTAENGAELSTAIRVKIKNQKIAPETPAPSHS